MDKFSLASVIIPVVAGMQIAAWYFGINGLVWSFTSLCIGGISGAIFGYSIATRNPSQPETPPKPPSKW